MGGVEDYEKLLKEIVGSKRVSQSKIQSISSVALKNMENDTKLISILYRTHKTLPAASKVSSLYVFDALARAARSHATKTKADQKSLVGNSATFLSKMEGVLDGLIRDMVSCGAPEAKEKTRKVVDIWSKANTFPKEVISRLVGITQTETSGGVEIGVDPNQSSTATQTHNVETSNRDGTGTSDHRPVDPRKPTTTTATILPANLLSLLSNQQVPSQVPQNGGQASTAHHRAVAPNPGQSVDPRLSNTNPAPPTPSLDVSQLALLQQLAAGLTNSSAQGTGKNSPVTLGGPLTGLPAEFNGFLPTESGRRPSEPSYGAGRPYDDRDNYRRDYRADDDRRGGHRGGRGGRYDGPYRDPRGGRWPDESRSPGSWNRVRDNDRRRSRSPPPRGGYYDRRGADNRRDHTAQPLSPSQRDQLTGSAGDATPSDPLVDEFGRELRKPTSPPQNQLVDVAARSLSETALSTPDTNQEFSNRESSLPQPIVSNPSIPKKRSRWGEPPPNVAHGSHSPSSHTGQEMTSANNDSSHIQNMTTRPIPTLDDIASTGSTKNIGLDKFDFTTFDFTNAESWEKLGNAWEVSYGRKPTPEEAMAAVTAQMMGGAGVSGSSAGWGMAAETSAATQGGDWNGGYGNSGRAGWRGGRGGRGRGRGRGGGGWQGGRGYTDQSDMDAGSTDAIVLGEGSDGGLGSSTSQYAVDQTSNGYWGGPDGSSHNMGMNESTNATGYSNYGYGYGDWNGNGSTSEGNNVVPVETQAHQIPNSTSDPNGENDDTDGVALEEDVPMSESPNGKSSGGKMIRVGDRWQWVKA